MERKRKRKTVDRLYKRQSGICYYCGTPMYKSNDTSVKARKRASIEHLTKRSDSGRYIQSNLVAAHASCNSNRQDLCKWQHLKNKGKRVDPYKDCQWCRRFFGEGRENLIASRPNMHQGLYDKIFSIENIDAAYGK